MGEALLEVIGHPTLYGPAWDSPHSGRTSFSHTCQKKNLVQKIEIAAFSAKRNDTLNKFF